MRHDRPPNEPEAGSACASGDAKKEGKRAIDTHSLIAVERADALTDRRTRYGHELVDHYLAGLCKGVMGIRLKLKAEQRCLDALGRQQADADARQMGEKIRLDNQSGP